MLAAAQATSTRYVDDDACPGPGTGSQGDPFCTIQDAILAAGHTDEVIVAPGVYPESIDLLGKPIHVHSSDGPEVTTLQTDIGSVVSVTSGETFDTIIEGFEITGGPGTLATNCTGMGPQEGLFGGGMYVINSRATVRNCTFTDNGNAPGDSIVGGAAVYVQDGWVTIRSAVA
jgi:hypothetical protein